jgi:hypothetical protein
MHFGSLHELCVTLHHEVRFPLCCTTLMLISSRFTLICRLAKCQVLGLLHVSLFTSGYSEQMSMFSYTHVYMNHGNRLFQCVKVEIGYKRYYHVGNDFYVQKIHQTVDL